MYVIGISEFSIWQVRTDTYHLKTQTLFVNKFGRYHDLTRASSQDENLLSHIGDPNAPDFSA